MWWHQGELAGSYCYSSSSVHFSRELADISSYLKVHHRHIAHLRGEQLREMHVSASARSPSHCIPHFIPERLLLVTPSAAEAQQLLPHLGYRAASAATPSAHVVVSESQLFRVLLHWPVSGLHSVEHRCQRLHTVHWDGSLASSFAFHQVAIMISAFVGLPLSLRHRLWFWDWSCTVRRRGVYRPSHSSRSAAHSR